MSISNLFRFRPVASRALLVTGAVFGALEPFALAGIGPRISQAVLDAMMPTSIPLVVLMAESFDPATHSVHRAISFTTGLVLIASAYALNIPLYAALGGLIWFGINRSRPTLLVTGIAICAWWIIAWTGGATRHVNG